MKTELIRINTRTIRVIPDPIDGWLYSLNDVCKKLLDSSNVSQAGRSLGIAGVVHVDVETSGGVQRMSFINNFNLMYLIIRGRGYKSESARQWLRCQNLKEIGQLTGLEKTEQTK